MRLKSHADKNYIYARLAPRLQEWFKPTVKLCLLERLEYRRQRDGIIIWPCAMAAFN